METSSRATAPLIEGWHDPEAWSTARVAPHRQFERWREFVVEAHLHWAIRSLRCESFPAYIRQGRFQGFRLTHITARQGGIVGTRGAAEIACDDEALFNLIYIPEGSIVLEIGGQPIVLKQGEFALWDTTRRMRFITGENLRQVTLVMPQDRLRRVLPRADDYVGRKLQAGESDVSRLFVDHLLSLDRSFGALPRAAAPQILDGAVELLAATLSAQVPLTESISSAVLLRQILGFIRRHLDQPGLTTQRIAEAHQISPRHLNRLFASLDASPAAWIRRQRLERCRQALAQPSGPSVTDIAYRWGFGDAGAFGKIFKKAYGQSPRTFRTEARSSAGNAAPER